MWVVTENRLEENARYASDDCLATIQGADEEIIEIVLPGQFKAYNWVGELIFKGYYYNQTCEEIIADFVQLDYIINRIEYYNDGHWEHVNAKKYLEFLCYLKPGNSVDMYFYQDGEIQEHKVGRVEYISEGRGVLLNNDDTLYVNGKRKISNKSYIMILPREGKSCGL